MATHLPEWEEKSDGSLIAGLKLRAALGDEQAHAWLTELCELGERCNAEGRDLTPDERWRLRFPPSPPYFLTTDRTILSN